MGVVAARAAENPRIVLIAESLSRDAMLALYGCCDVFLSPHRSGGFGRGTAEALQLCVDVIANDFGGNANFCTGPMPIQCGGEKLRSLGVAIHMPMGTAGQNQALGIQRNFVSSGCDAAGER